MRRAILTLGGTVAGLAALFSFKTHSLAGVAAIDPPSAPKVTAPAIAGTGAAPMKTAARAPRTGTGSAGTPSTGAGNGASSSATRVVTGTVASTQYGPMQIQLTLAGQQITKVTVLQQTDDGTESMQIDATALPRLTSETLAAQNANIDAVSGASYTSAGYIKSLQSALDQSAA